MYLLDVVRSGRLVRDGVEAIAQRLGEVDQTRLMLYGHSHRPDMVLLPSGVLIGTPGSVGCPAYDDPSDPAHVSEADSPHARYALLDFPAAGAIGVIKPP